MTGELVIRPAEGQPLFDVHGDPVWQHAGPSLFIRSSCCDAPVVSTLMLDAAVYPVSCSKCGMIAGTPGWEDLEQQYW